MNIKKRSVRINFLGYSLMSPYIIFMSVFWLYPFVWAFILVFCKWNILSPKKTFVGLQNFIMIFSDTQFWGALLNILYFMAVYIPLVITISLLLASLINKIKYLQNFFLIGFLLAYVSSGVAYSIVFKLLFAGDGVINSFLSKFNIYIPWFTNPKIAMASIAIIVAWKITGYYTLIFFAGLKSIPNSLYESARIDGANRRTIFWKITFPLLNPAFTTVLVFAVIISFAIFAEPFMITYGGPEGSTNTFVFLIYRQAWEMLHAGYASLMAVFAAAISFITIRIIKKLVERDVSV